MRRSNTIIEKIEKFIRKFYLNRLIRGSMLSITLLSVVFILMNVAEYYSWFETTTRKMLFFGFIAFFAVVLIGMVFIPIMKILKIGRKLTYKKAAFIIGDFFTEISDRLTNLLQLLEMDKMNQQQYGLLSASIEQKTKDLKVLDFRKAVSFKASRKLIKYLVFSTCVLAIILVVSPQMITSSTQRIFDYNTTYEAPKPFEFHIMNKELKAIQNEDYLVEVKVTGEVIPGSVFIEYNKLRYRLKKDKSNIFTYKFKNLTRDTRFSLISGVIKSKDYIINVYPKPIIIEFESFLNYPDYTGKDDEVIGNIGDLIVPEGTVVTWKIYTKNTDTLIFYYGDEQKRIGKSGTNVIEISKAIMIDEEYAFYVQNENVEKNDSIAYKVEIIKDAYPSINVKQYTDSTEQNRRFFNGLIQDDYGFSSLNYEYKITNIEGKLLDQGERPIEVDKARREQTFMYQINFTDFNIKPGNEIIYYFRICDNDAINGAKCKNSEKYSYTVKTEEEIEQEIEKKSEEITNSLEESLNGLREINKELDKFRKKILGGEELNWQDEKRIEELYNKQLELQKSIEDIQKQNREKIQKEERELNKDAQLLEKQKQLQELLDKVLDEETKKLLEELQELMGKIDKQKMEEMIEKMQMSNKEMEQELDRNINLLKMLQFENKLKEMLSELDSLISQQDNLANKTKNKDKSEEELLKDQEDIKKEYEELEKEMDKMKELSEELDENFEFPDERNKNELKSDFKESINQLQKSNNKKAAKSQKSASEKMSKMLEMFQNMQSAMQQQQGEDINTIRGLLENVIKVSFDQEELMNELLNAKKGDPKYVTILQRQNELGEEIDLIEDSLRAIAKRNIMVQPVITKEIGKIRERTKKVNENLQERDIRIGSANQQYIMTSLNNLALFLAESLKNMQSNMNMNNKMPGNSSCQKPGEGQQQGSNSLGNMQERLNKQIEELKKQLNGEGGKGNKNKKGLSEQFARMAAEQEMIRKRLQEYMEELEGKGQFDEELKKAYEDMEKSEEEIINKIINDETINRQKDILTRLLKSEKAEREREKSEQRESKEAKSYEISNPNSKIEYKSGDYSEEELLRKLSPKLKEYYKSKAKKYLYEYLVRDEK